MSKVAVDLDSNTAVLVHDLTEAVSDITQLPAEAHGAIQRLADSLHVGTESMNNNSAGWLFDLLMAATDAIGGGPTADAAAPAAAPAGIDPSHVPGPTPIEPPATAEPGAGQAQAPGAVPDAAPEPTDAVAVDHGPADTDLPPVTVPDAGYEICPKCSGFRTILDSGAVVVCPECKGAGQIPVASA